jgi:chemosensory pili system protein ChpA (sensor histidine kinase/response regulator)
LIQQARVNTELQEGLMRTRMVPFNRLLPRLGARSAGGARARQGSRLHAYNAEGELDRNVLERMVPPLEHMLRNAVDHGIERADSAAGSVSPMSVASICVCRERPVTSSSRSSTTAPAST